MMTIYMLATIANIFYFAHCAVLFLSLVIFSSFFLVSNYSLLSFSMKRQVFFSIFEDTYVFIDTSRKF